MNYIKRLKLENFQSHKESEIIFDPGMTVIIGQTDHGKSSIIRALKWVLYNEPRGSDFITVGCKSCRVTLEMQDGTTIIRERDGSKNRYILIKGDQKEVFEGFGNTVPLEITQAHGIPKLYLNKDSSSAVNLAEQLEPPFLISENGSNKAKALGQLIGIHIIDEAQRTVIKDLLDNQQSQKALAKKIEELKSELEEYDILPKLESTAEAIREVLSQLKSKRSYYLQLNQLRTALIPNNEGINNAAKIINMTSFVNEAQVYVLKCNATLDKMYNLIKFKNRLANIEAEMDAEQSTIKKLKGVDLAQNLLLHALQKHEKYCSLISSKNAMTRTTEAINIVEKIISGTSVLTAVEEIKTISENKIEKLKKYIRLRDELGQIERYLIQENNIIHSTNGINAADNTIKTLIQKTTKLDQLNKLRNKLNEVSLSINKGEEYLKGCTKEIITLANQYSSSLKKLAICPTCFNPIGVEAAEKIASDIIKM